MLSLLDVVISLLTFSWELLSTTKAFTNSLHDLFHLQASNSKLNPSPTLNIWLLLQARENSLLQKGSYDYVMLTWMIFLF
jgi:hypothetical protein